MGMRRLAVILSIIVIAAAPFSVFITSLSAPAQAAGVNTPGSLASSFFPSTVSSAYPSNASYSTVQQGSGTYTVYLNETGLMTGSEWHASIGGKTYSTNSSSIILELQGGKYAYSYGTASSYIPFYPSGSANITGNTSLILPFIPSLSVSESLSLSNGTLLNGNVVFHNSQVSPMGIASDPANNMTYVADSSSNHVFVVSPAGHIIKAIDVGANPGMILYNPYNSYMYVSNSGSGNISVINSNSNVIGSIAAGDFPFGMAYDPATHNMYVANSFSSSVSVVHFSSPSSIGSTAGSITLPAGTIPFSAVYSSSTGYVYVSDINSTTIYTISGSAVKGSISVYGTPAMMTYDSSNGNVYVTDSETSASTGNGYISVINSGTGSSAVNIRASGFVNPFGITYDKSRNLLYVSGSTVNQLGVFNPSTVSLISTVNVGSEPYGISVGRQSSSLWIANYDSGTVSILNFSKSVHSLQFVESGLKQGSAWSVTLGNITEKTTGHSILFNETAGSYNYSISSVKGYYTGNSSGILEMGASPTVVNVNYSKLYNVTINGSGLPAGSSWGFSLPGQNITTLSPTTHIELVNGTYAFGFHSDAKGYFAEPATLVVNGSNTTLNVTFRAEYGVDFTEHGLTAGHPWSIVLNGTTHSSSTGSMHFMLPDGTYSYSIGEVGGFMLHTTGGNITVSGKPVNVSVNFTEMFSVQFTEHGLSRGSNWYVEFNGSLHETSGRSISFAVPNGTYSYSILNSTGYILHNGSGAITISGSDASLSFIYHKEYQVAFTRAPFLASTPWNVTVGGMTGVSGNGSVTFMLTNGSYNFSTPAMKGFIDSQPSGMFSINGTSRNISIAYHRLYGISFHESGLPSGRNWEMAFNGTVHSSGSRWMNFTMTNGTYGYKVSGVPLYILENGSGVLHIDGSGAVVNVTFLPFVHMQLRGLHVPDVAWHLMLGGTIYNSTGDVVNLTVPPGNYSYSAYYSLDGIQVWSNGSFMAVEEGNVTMVAFPHLYSITFMETGLPDGASWSVSLNGFNTTSDNSSITFTVPNGTYSFTLYSPDGQLVKVKLLHHGNEMNAQDSRDGNWHHGDQNRQNPVVIHVSGENVTAMAHFHNNHGHWWDRWSHDFGLLIHALEVLAREAESVMRSGISYLYMNQWHHGFDLGGLHAGIV